MNLDANGLWNDGNNWSDALAGITRLPKSGDDAWISRSAAPTLVYDAAADPNLASLHHTDPTAFVQRQGSLTIQNEYYWGGSLDVSQTAGAAASVHTVGSTLTDGKFDVANASVHVSGSATLNVWGTAQIGDDQGGATFTHDGATVNITGRAATLNIGWDGSTSTYDLGQTGTPFAILNAGLILLGNGAPGGNGGGWGLFQQGGGVVTTGTLNVGAINQGGYTMTGGSLKVGAEVIGSTASGGFTQNAGTHTVTGSLSVAATGTYTINGGQLNASQLVNRGVVEQTSSSSVTITGISGGNDLVTSGPAADRPGYLLFDSSRLVVNGNEAVGDSASSAGSFTQSGAGTFHNISGTLTIGNAGAQGASEYDLKDGALIAQNLSLFGGNLVQTGGTSSVPGTLTVAAGQMYDLQVGSLTSTIANITGAGARIRLGPPATAHLIVLQGDGTMQVNAGGKALFDTPGGLNEIDPTVNNSGTLALVAGSDISVGSSAVINNNAGGLFDLQIDAGLAGHGGTFNNSGGTFQKSGGSGTSAVSGITLTNSGTIDGQTGTLDLNVTGTNAGAINSEANATVKLGGAWTLNGGAFNGTGVTNLYGNATLMASVTASTQFQVASGGVLQGSGYTFTSSNELDLRDGSAASSPTGAAPLTIASQRTLNVTGIPSLSGVVLNAQGATNQSSGGVASAALSCAANTIINNSGTWTVADDSGIASDGTSAFNNSGNFLKTGGSGTTAVAVAFNNTGTINAESGTIDLQGGGSGNGTFVAASGATLKLGGNVTLGGGASFTGGGTAVLYGTVTQTGDVTSNVTTQLAATGVLQGAGSHFITSNYFDWAGAVRNALNNAAGGKLLIEPDAVLDGGTLNNAGQATLVSGGVLTGRNATFNNTGTFIIEPGATLNGDGQSTTVFNNQSGGTLMAGGTGTANVVAAFIENQGTVNANLGTLVLDGGHGAAGSIFTATGGGTLELQASGSSGWTFDAGTQFSASGGVVETASGTSYTINGTVTNSGHFLLAANSTIPGPGQILNMGQFDWSGQIGAGLTLHNADLGTVTVIGSGTPLAGTLINDAKGTVLFPNDDSFLAVPGGTITNNGVIIFQANGGIGSSYPPSGNMFINNGEIDKTGGTDTLIDIPFQNSSTAIIVVTSGTVRLAGGGINQGTFHGGTFELHGTWTLADSVVEGDAHLVIDGPTTVTGTVQAVNATITVGSVLTVPGTILNQSLVNNGAVYFSGTIEGGTVTNNFNFYISGGTMDCSVVNNAWFEVLGGEPTVKSFDNEGTLKLDHASLNVTDGFINNGTILSDPADSHYHDLTVTTKGALVGGNGDRFFVSGDLRSQSQNATGWSTAAAQLLFENGTVHIFDVNGRDLGPTAAGYQDNFAWGRLTLGEGEKLILDDPTGSSGAALYLQWLDLPDGLAQISSIEADGVNIYYDPTQPGDSYLGGQTFTLAGGGLLMPDPNDPAAIATNLPAAGSAAALAVPLPPQVVPAGLMIAAAGCLALRTRRRRSAFESLPSSQAVYRSSSASSCDLQSGGESLMGMRVASGDVGEDGCGVTLFPVAVGQDPLQLGQAEMICPISVNLGDVPRNNMINIPPGGDIMGHGSGGQRAGGQSDEGTKGRRDKGTEARRHGGTKGRRDGGTKGRRGGGMEGQRDGGMEGRRDGGTEGRRDEGTKGRRDGGTEGRRGEGTEGRRDEGTKGRRDGGTKGRRDKGAEGWKRAEWAWMARMLGRGDGTGARLRGGRGREPVRGYGPGGGCGGCWRFSGWGRSRRLLRPKSSRNRLVVP